jgi:hypothetical protein
VLGRRTTGFAAAAWVGGLTLAVLLLDAPPFLRGVASVTGGFDNSNFNFPIRVEVARQWLSGRLPLWNPYNFAGFPLLGDITSGALYPGNLPFLLDASARRYDALDRVAALHFVLAGLFMYAFARSVALGRAASCLAGLVYAGNGVFLFFASHWIQALSAAVWLPLILAAVGRASQPRSFRLWTAIGAGAVALQTLSGYPQYSFYTGLLAGAFALVLTLARGTGRWRPVWAVVLIYALGTALAAVQLLPTLDLVRLSRRSGVVSLVEFLALPAAPNVFRGLVLPRAVASPAHPYFVLGGVFVGTLTAVLAVEGARSRRSVQVFLTVVLVVGMLLALGPFTPVGAVSYWIPGLNAFRYPFKHLFEVVFCLAALAGFGAQSLLDDRRGARACVALGALAAACWVASILRVAPGSHWSVFVSAIGCAGFAALVLLRRPGAAVALGLVVLWLSLAGNREAVFVLGQRTIPEPPPVADVLARRRESVLGPRYAAVILPREGGVDAHALLALDYPAEFQIPALHGTSPFVWTAFRRAAIMTENGTFGFPEVLFGGTDRTLDVLGVRYVGTAGRPLPGTVVAQETSATVVERASALPALRFVDRALCATPIRAFRQLRRPQYDPATVALVDCEGKPPLPQLAPSSGGARIVLLDAAPGFLRARVRLRRGGPGMLIVSQSDIPGWRARIDGVAAPIYRAYGLVQGVVVPDGVHDVELEYRPPGLVAGAWASGTALAAVLALAALGYRDLRRGPAA